MLFQLLVTLSILLFVTSGSASPLYFRSPTSTIPTPTTIVQTSTLITATPDVTSSVSRVSSRVGNGLDLTWMLEGNEKFQEQRADFHQVLTDSPSILFLGCSDNKFNPDMIFQSGVGSTTTHFNLGNQFLSQDDNSNAAISYAAQELGVKHIVVLGHYGCNSIEKAASQLVGSGTNQSLQKWLQPITDLYFSSKRLEIRRLRVLRKGSDTTAMNQAAPSGLRALVEENVKASVQNLMKELMPLLNGTENIELYGHGFVFNEETGEVADLDVSFGPPGRPVVQVPFKAVPKARMHIPYGKFDARAKKRDPSGDQAGSV